MPASKTNIHLPWVLWCDWLMGISHSPGMMLEPGSFSGRMSSPRPERGPEPRKRMSLAIFIMLTDTVFKAPLSSTSASWAARASNLFGAVTKGRPANDHTITSGFSDVITRDQGLLAGQILRWGTDWSQTLQVKSPTVSAPLHQQHKQISQVINALAQQWNSEKQCSLRKITTIIRYVKSTHHLKINRLQPKYLTF